MVHRADLFERVRKRIVPDVVQKGGDRGSACIRRGRSLILLLLLEQRQRSPGEVICPERVLEPGMGRARVDQERQPSCRTYRRRWNAGVSISSKLSGSSRMLFQSGSRMISMDMGVAAYDSHALVEVPHRKRPAETTPSGVSYWLPCRHPPLVWHRPRRAGRSPCLPRRKLR